MRAKRWTLIAVVLCATLLSVAQALAHASLLRSEPADRAVMARPPATLRLAFNEPVTPLVLRLVDPGGRAVDLTAAESNDATLTVALPPGLADGTHLLSWRVISADGHPVGGALTFSIGAPSATQPAAPVPSSGRWAIWSAKVVLYLGLFVGVGGAFYVTWIGRRSRRPRMIDVALWAGLPAAALSLGLQGVDALGMSWTALVMPRVWMAGFDTSFGMTAVLAVAAMLCGLVALRLRRRAGRWLGALALAGVGAALASSGHASTAAPQALMRTMVVVHAVSVAFWAGALMPLRKAMGQGAGGVAELMRFSRAIPVPFAALLLSGIVLAVVQLGEVDALWTTDYGLVLLAKLAVVLALVVAAVANRWLTPRAAAGDPVAVRRLRRSITGEVVGVLLVFALVALWRFTPPPRALIAVEHSPVHVHIHTGAAMADITFSPSPGGRQAAISVLNGQFAPLAAEAVTLQLSAPDRGIEALRFPAQQTAEASNWRVATLPALALGRWHVRLDILVSDFERISLDDDVDLPR